MITGQARTENLSSVDAARMAELEQKARLDGLQESEKEELKQLGERARAAI